MKRPFFPFFLILIFFSSIGFSQNIVECGIINHDEDISDSTLILHFDRFGNGYTSSTPTST